MCHIYMPRVKKRWFQTVTFLFGGTTSLRDGSPDRLDKVEATPATNTRKVCVAFSTSKALQDPEYRTLLSTTKQS